MTQSKHHHQSPVRGTTISSGSRAMARSPRIAFADHDQELRFLKEQWGALSAEFVRIKEAKAEEMGIASRQCDQGREWETARSAIESEYQRVRANLVEQQAEIQAALTAVKVKIKQRNERENPQLPLQAKLDHFVNMTNMLGSVLEKLDSVSSRLDAIEQRLSVLDRCQQ